jgi:hypothetical protein
VPSGSFLTALFVSYSSFSVDCNDSRFPSNEASPFSLVIAFFVAFTSIRFDLNASRSLEVLAGMISELNALRPVRPVGLFSILYFIDELLARDCRPARGYASGLGSSLTLVSEGFIYII